MTFAQPSSQRPMRRPRALLTNLILSLICLAMIAVAAVIYRQTLPRYELYALPGALALGMIYFIRRFRRQTTQTFKRAYETIMSTPPSLARGEARGRLLGERHVGLLIAALMGAAFGLNLWAWVSVPLWLLWVVALE